MDKRKPIESRKETNLLKAIEDREVIIRLSSITINQLETKQSLLTNISAEERILALISNIK